MPGVESFLYPVLALIFFFPFLLHRLWWSTSLDCIPGPLAARFTSIYRIYVLWSGKCNEKYESLHKQYGPLVRIGPNHIIASDPAIIFTIYDAGWRFPKVSLAPGENNRLLKHPERFLPSLCSHLRRKNKRHRILHTRYVLPQGDAIARNRKILSIES